MAPVAPVLEGARLRLRPAHEEEAPVIFEWLSDPATLYSLNVEEPFYLDEASLSARFQDAEARLEFGQMQILMEAVLPPDRIPNRVTVMYDSSLKPFALTFALTNKENDALVGVIVLRVSVLNRTGLIRTVIAPEYRRQKFGQEAKELILGYAFAHLKLRKVSSHLLKENVATFKLNKKLGFAVEGILEEEVVVQGKSRDLMLMAITRLTWLGRQSSHKAVAA